MYGQMGYLALTNLSETELTQFRSISGATKQRQALLSIWLKENKDIKATIHRYFEATRSVSITKNDDVVPMTKKMINRTFGKKTGKQVIDDCKRDGNYQVDQRDPKNEDRWWFQVWTGTRLRSETYGFRHRQAFELFE